MKILVTGANGFVGKNLTAALKNIKDNKDRTRPSVKIEEVFEFDIDTPKELLQKYCNETDFAPEIQNVATSIRLETGKPVDRSRLANAMLRQFQSLSRELQSGKDAWLAEFAAHCVTIGKQVQVVRGDSVREAVAEGIDGEAALLVRYPDGSREAVSSGEVSVRGMYGYLD